MKKKIILIILLLFLCGISVKADIRDDSLENLEEINNTEVSNNEHSIIFPILITITTASCIVAFVLYQLSSEKKREKINNSLTDSKTKKIDENIINDIDKDLNVTDFCEFAYNRFILIQKALCDFDEETLKKYMTDELYNTSQLFIKNLKQKEQKNIVSDFSNIKTYINNIEKDESKEQIDVTIVIMCKNYIVDRNNNIVSGQDKQLYEMHYLVSFIKKTNEWLMCSKKLVNQKLEEEAKFYDK